MIIEMGNDIFPQNLVYLRQKYALSRRALAKLIGIPQVTLEQIEKLIAYPAMSQEAFLRVCEVFHVTPDDLAQTDLSKT